MLLDRFKAVSWINWILALTMLAYLILLMNCNRVKNSKFVFLDISISGAALKEVVAIWYSCFLAHAEFRDLACSISAAVPSSKGKWGMWRFSRNWMCRQHGMCISAKHSGGERRSRSLQKGFPNNNSYINAHNYKMSTEIKFIAVLTRIFHLVYCGSNQYFSPSLLRF